MVCSGIPRLLFTCDLPENCLEGRRRLSLAGQRHRCHGTRFFHYTIASTDIPQSNILAESLESPPSVGHCEINQRLSSAHPAFCDHRGDGQGGGFHPEDAGAEINRAPAGSEGQGHFVVGEPALGADGHHNAFG